jgi:hypothetical protein
MLLVSSFLELRNMQLNLGGKKQSQNDMWSSAVFADCRKANLSSSVWHSRTPPTSSKQVSISAHKSKATHHTPVAPPPTDATMASPDAETSPPSTPTTTASCPTPRPLAAAAPPTMSPELLRAARAGDERRLVKALLADPAAPDMEAAATAGGNTLLHVAAAGGHADLASLLLRRAPRLLAARNAALDTPLHLAARAGEHKFVALLVTASSSSASSPSLRALTRVTNRRGDTALHDAVRGAHEAAARALATADPGLVGLCGGAGESPLYMAAAAGSLEMVRLLLKEYRNKEEEEEDEVPVSRSCTGPGGRTVLHAAVLASNGEFLTNCRLEVLPLLCS